MNQLGYNLRWIKRELLAHFRDSSVEDARYSVMMTLGHEQMESQYDGRPVIRPNHRGQTLLALWEHFVLQPYIIIRQGFCNHDQWEDDSWAGPDSGGVAGHCEKCGHSMSVTFY